MNGSPKQIEWAQKIKPQIVALAEDEMIQQSISRGATDEFLDRLRTALRQAADEQDAKFWIDGRLNGRTPVQETFVAINALRKRTAAILKEQRNG
jgi:hypothetical protein